MRFYRVKWLTIRHTVIYFNICLISGQIFFLSRADLGNPGGFISYLTQTSFESVHVPLGVNASLQTEKVNQRL